MESKRSSVIIVLCSILIFLLLTLLGLWGYNYYSLEKTKKNQAVLTPVTSPVILSTKDSLQQIYSETIANFDTALDSTWLNADSLQKNLDFKLTEFYKLRSEISSLLKNNPDAASLGLAKQKIEELQLRVELLRERNTDVELENKRLSNLLKRLSQEKTSGATKPFTSSAAPTNVSFIEKIESIENKTKSGLFSASQLKLIAANENDKETNAAESTDKLFCTFFIKSPVSLNNAEIFVIVKQPNGKILKNSAWETGLFETKEDGRKMYSQKLNFDYTKGEVKLCNFSITSENYPKGNYTMEIYHNGIMIGNTVKTIS